MFSFVLYIRKQRKGNRMNSSWTPRPLNTKRKLITEGPPSLDTKDFGAHLSGYDVICFGALHFG